MTSQYRAGRYPTQSQEEMWLYCAITIDKRAMKVGVTKNLLRRYYGLNHEARELFGDDSSVRFLAVMRGTPAKEHQIHRECRTLLLAKNEWYSPSQMIPDYFRESRVPLDEAHDGFCRKHGVYICICSAVYGTEWRAQHTVIWDRNKYWLD